MRPCAAMEENEHRLRFLRRPAPVNEQLLARIVAITGAVHQFYVMRGAGQPVDSVEYGRTVALDGNQHRSGADQAEAEKSCKNSH